MKALPEERHRVAAAVFRANTRSPLRLTFELAHEPAAPPGKKLFNRVQRNPHRRRDTNVGGVVDAHLDGAAATRAAHQLVWNQSIAEGYRPSAARQGRYGRRSGFNAAS